MDAFFASPEAKSVFDQYGNYEWPLLMMQFAVNDLGVMPHKMSLAQFNEILFHLFPRRVSTEPESAESIVAELRAFWNFLHRQYGLINARMIADSLTNAATQRLKRELASSEYSIAKILFMLAQQAGFDMNTQEGIAEFMAAHNNDLVDDMSKVEGEPTSLPPPLFPSPLSPKQRAEKRKKRKAQRQARKRNRR